MPGIPTYSSSAYLSLPPTTLSFWQYISSPLLSHSLQTVLSAPTNPKKRLTVSSITTSFAQFKHVIGSIMSSSDPAAAEFFEWVLTTQLNLSAEKINTRWLAMREAMKEALVILVEDNLSAMKRTKRSHRLLHPAVIEAKELLHEMRLEDEEQHLYQTKSSTKYSQFLEAEEQTLQAEFHAFKRDIPGPSGRSPNPALRPLCPPLILSLRIYHDGLLSVDSKHAFQPTLSRRPSSNKRPSPHRDSNSLQQHIQNKRINSLLANPTSNSFTASVGSSMSFLERQFFEAMQIRPLRQREPIEHDTELSRLLDEYNPDYEVSFRGDEKDAISVSISPKSRSGSVVSTFSAYQPPLPVAAIHFSDDLVDLPPRRDAMTAKEISLSRRQSGAESEKSETSTIGKIQRKKSQYTWRGDWETEDEEEFYREALKYNPSR